MSEAHTNIEVGGARVRGSLPRAVRGQKRLHCPSQGVGQDARHSARDFVEESFPGIGARRGEPEVNSYINPLSASESEPVGRAAAGQAPQHNSAEHDSLREASVDHAESGAPASWSRSAWPTPATVQCDSIDEPDSNNDGGADEAADNYEPLTKVGRGSGRTQVLPEPDLRI